MEDVAITNARYQGIALAVAAIARGDRISTKIRGKLSVTECETAHLLMQKLGVSLADFEAAGAAANDLDTIRQAFACLDEFYRWAAANKTRQVIDGLMPPPRLRPRRNSDGRRAKSG
jgi:hypothetical protein